VSGTDRSPASGGATERPAASGGGIRGIGDAYAFQRLLWLLIGTVIVPTVLLSLFGVAAIRNQGAAVLHELDRVRTERLQLGARTLARAVNEVEQGARAVDCDLARCDPHVAGTSAAWVWQADAPVPPELAALGVSAALARDQEPVWVSPIDGTAPVLVYARGALRLAWRLDPAPLRAELQALRGDRMPQHVSIELAEPDPARSALLDFASTDEVRLDLPRPLSGWRLRLDDTSDPTRAALRRNAWLYPASLILLVGVVLVGTIVTLGSAARELRLSRLQTDFVSSVSHELRTPLTSIRLFVETLQSGRLQDPARVQECLDLLALETDRLSRMIERVLDWAKMEAGRRQYQFALVQPAELVSEALRSVRSQRLLDGDDPIEVHVPADLPAVRADRDAIVEALVNLLLNAIKYTPPPRRIEVRAGTRGGWLTISVSDNGPGIAKRHRKRIFEKFYRVDLRLSAPVQGRIERGSGLGLSIVRSVVRAHRGRIELDTEIGRGSRFRITLPLPKG
jgi:two-component system, OmpR family, phosphate regulon sensor histidine kinase PhoR